jgi:hypothetical protein
VAATVGIKWPGALPSKDDPRAARAQPDPRRVRLLTCGLEAHSARVVATGALDLGGLLISGSWVSLTLKPSSPADAKSLEHPASTPQWPY